MSLGLIWAEARGGVIGRDGVMPWHLPEDLAHFKAVTLGAPVIMGRRTWDSIPDRFRPLVDRRNIVVTRDPLWSAPGAEPAHSIEQALELADVTSRAGDDDGSVSGARAWVIGGAQLYAATLAHADRLEVTHIDLDTAGDAWAPEVPPHFEPLATSEWMTSRTGLRYRFVSYERREPPTR